MECRAYIRLRTLVRRTFGRRVGGRSLSLTKLGDLFAEDFLEPGEDLVADLDAEILA